MFRFASGRVYVRNDGNVTDIFHERVPGRGGARNMAASSEKIKPDDLDGCDKLQIPPNEYSRGS